MPNYGTTGSEADFKLQFQNKKNLLVLVDQKGTSFTNIVIGLPVKQYVPVYSSGSGILNSPFGNGSKGKIIFNYIVFQLMK